MAEDGAPVRIGILGAAHIAPAVVIIPAKGRSDVVVAAVAARDVSRAREFATKHGIARVHDTYEDLLDDPDVDAVYNPLPNALHGKWIRAALAAGKHVFCEKPLTANAEEAREIAELTSASGRVVMEGLYYRYLPFAARVHAIIDAGELGTLQRIEAANCFWLPKFSNVRYDYSMGGGSLMDLGIYIVDLVRTFGGSTPEVVSAEAQLRSPEVDRAMTAELRFTDGLTGRLRSSLWSKDLPHFSARIVGDRGELRLHPLAPFQHFTVRTSEGKRVERFRLRGLYGDQLAAFVAAVSGGEPVKTTPAAAVENMTVIDAIYRAAGLSPRQPR